ncbi:hypothetical protein KM043_012632 [Ampulex compressa]|nr:hypothetical protein KM043_012632 [Ampulex compressa]
MNIISGEESVSRMSIFRILAKDISEVSKNLQRHKRNPRIAKLHAVKAGVIANAQIAAVENYGGSDSRDRNFEGSRHLAKCYRAPIKPLEMDGIETVMQLPRGSQDCGMQTL